MKSQRSTGPNQDDSVRISLAQSFNYKSGICFALRLGVAQGHTAVSDGHQTHTFLHSPRRNLCGTRPPPHSEPPLQADSLPLGQSLPLHLTAGRVHRGVCNPGEGVPGAGREMLPWAFPGDSAEEKPPGRSNAGLQGSSVSGGASKGSGYRT